MKTFWPLLLLSGCILALHAQTNAPSEPAPAAPEIPAIPTTESPTNPPAEPLPRPAVRPPNEIEILSDHFTGDLKGVVLSFTKNVRVTDDPIMRLTCESLVYEQPRFTNAIKFNRITAAGNVLVRFIEGNETNHARADRIVYTFGVTNGVTNAVVVLSGSPVITNSQFTFRGEPIVWDRMTGLIESDKVEANARIPGTNTPTLLAPPTQLNR